MKVPLFCIDIFKMKTHESLKFMIIMTPQIELVMFSIVKQLTLMKFATKRNIINAKVLLWWVIMDKY